MKTFILLLFCCTVHLFGYATKVDLTIIPPNTDGGGRLVYYYVECMEEGSDFWKVLKRVPKD